MVIKYNTKVMKKTYNVNFEITNSLHTSIHNGIQMSQNENQQVFKGYQMKSCWYCILGYPIMY